MNGGSRANRQTPTPTQNQFADKLPRARHFILVIFFFCSGVAYLLLLHDQLSTWNVTSISLSLYTFLLLSLSLALASVMLGRVVFRRYDFYVDANDLQRRKCGGRSITRKEAYYRIICYQITDKLRTYSSHFFPSTVSACIIRIHTEFTIQGDAMALSLSLQMNDNALCGNLFWTIAAPPDLPSQNYEFQRENSDRALVRYVPIRCSYFYQKIWLLQCRSIDAKKIDKFPWQKGRKFLSCFLLLQMAFRVQPIAAKLSFAACISPGVFFLRLQVCRHRHENAFKSEKVRQRSGFAQDLKWR